MGGREILPWHLQSFLKAPCFLLYLREGTLVFSNAWAGLCGECIRSCECALGFHPLTPRLGSSFPDTFCWGRTSSPCPHHPASHPETWLSLGWGLSPFSMSLARAGIAASFIPSQRPGPPGLLCQSFCGRGSLTSFSPSKPRGLRRVCQLVRGHCSSSRIGERHRGDAALGRES